jgi:hypothetical protein
MYRGTSKDLSHAAVLDTVPIDVDLWQHCSVLKVLPARNAENKKNNHKQLSESEAQKSGNVNVSCWGFN